MWIAAKALQLEEMEQLDRETDTGNGGELKAMNDASDLAQRESARCRTPSFAGRKLPSKSVPSKSSLRREVQSASFSDRPTI